MELKKEKPKRVDKKMLTFFLITFPTLLIIVLANIGNQSWGWIIEIALAVYQFILLKQFLDNYYEVLD